jgi:hypothetical protein
MAENDDRRAEQEQVDIEVAKALIDQDDVEI